MVASVDALLLELLLGEVPSCVWSLNSFQSSLGSGAPLHSCFHRKVDVLGQPLVRREGTAN